MGFLSKTLDGIVLGFSQSIDPSFLINNLEYQLGGASLADSSPTAGQQLSDKVIGNPEDLDFWDYLGRGLGYAIASPVKLVYYPIKVLPALLWGGLLGYGAYKRVTSEKKQGSFYDGLKYGFHRGIDPLSAAIHDVSFSLSGKGPYQSRWQSDINYSSEAAGTNLGSMVGGFIGTLGGAVVSVASLGIVPLVQGIRSAYRTYKSRKAAKK